MQAHKLTVIAFSLGAVLAFGKIRRRRLICRNPVVLRFTVRSRSTIKQQKWATSTSWAPSMLGPLHTMMPAAGRFTWEPHCARAVSMTSTVLTTTAAGAPGAMPTATNSSPYLQGRAPTTLASKVRTPSLEEPGSLRAFKVRARINAKTLTPRRVYWLAPNSSTTPWRPRPDSQVTAAGLASLRCVSDPLAAR